MSQGRDFLFLWQSDVLCVSGSELVTAGLCPFSVALAALAVSAWLLHGAMSTPTKLECLSV